LTAMVHSSLFILKYSVSFSGYGLSARLHIMCHSSNHAITI
jgi:hypothetical protein